MGIALPTSTPCALVAGHAHQEADIAETCEFESGEARRAPIYRSVPNLVNLRWPSMTQAQFDNLMDWFELDLLAGSLPADIPVAEQGSAAAVVVEAMFLAPPQCRAQSGGRWLVSASVVTDVPFNGSALGCFTEVFAAGLAPYSVVSGSAAPFSIFATGAYGQGLQTTIGTPGTSVIRRAIPARNVTSVSLKFRMTSLGSDDACTLSLRSGAGFTFVFDPRRELASSGGTGWPSLGVGSASTSALGASALSASTWYQLDVTLSATTPAVITRLSDSVVVATANFGDHSAGVAADAIEFGNDSGDASHSETSYADIHLC